MEYRMSLANSPTPPLQMSKLTFFVFKRHNISRPRLASFRQIAFRAVSTELRPHTSSVMPNVETTFEGIPLTRPSSLSEERIQKEAKSLKNWLSKLKSSLALQASLSHPFHADPYALKSIIIQSYDVWGSRLGFLKIDALVQNEAGETIPASAMLRGSSVAMLVMLIPDDAKDDERYVVLTVQPRIPAGSLAFVELPAGMVDDGTFKGAAAREIQEELGIEIPEDALTNLSELAVPSSQVQDDEGLEKAMWPSAGGCDETIQIFSHERKVSRKELEDWQGRLTGLREEGEKITLKVVAMKDLWKEGARDAKALAAVALWEGLRREGKV